MAAMPAKLVDTPLTLPASGSLPLGGPPDKEFYLKEGLDGLEHHQYRDWRSFISVIEARADELGSGDLRAGQYVVFDSVTQDKLRYIERMRDTRYKQLRFMHLPAGNTLVAKIVPGVLHHLATNRFEKLLEKKIAHLEPDCELVNLGCATFEGILGRKEPDIAFKPGFARRWETDWPTVVVECGIQESYRRLTVDSRWWLENTAGEVNIVLLFSISQAERIIHLEQWELAPVPNPQVTGSHPSLILSPKRIRQIDILATGVNGAPLTLSFQKVFLRPPIEDLGERDIVFTEKELQSYGASVWKWVDLMRRNLDSNPKLKE